MTGGTYAPQVIIAFTAVRMDESVVAGKLSDDVRTGTGRAILKQTGMEEPEK
jgi:hypothetical protein